MGGGGQETAVCRAVTILLVSMKPVVLTGLSVAKWEAYARGGRANPTTAFLLAGWGPAQGRRGD